MQEWSKMNKGYRYILNVIDCFSKYAWSVPLKDKKGETVLDAFKYIVKISDRKPAYIWVDEGKEFYNKDMTAWLKAEKITRYSTHGEHKSAIAERFNRTLKEMMWRRFTAGNTRNWIDMLDELLIKYNKYYHRTIRMRPVDASKEENESEVWENLFRDDEQANKSKKFKIGDTVRISRIKVFSNMVSYQIGRNRCDPYDASKEENESEVWENLFRDDEQLINQKNLKSVIL